MSVAASARDSASLLSSLQELCTILHEATRVLQTWAPQMKGFRLGIVLGLSWIRLWTMLFLGMIFLPRIYCDMDLSYYSSYEIVIPKSLTTRRSEDPVERASYMLFMGGQKQLVHLKVKREYVVNNFPVYSYHDGVLGQETPFISRDCHYEGYIEGVPGSFVSVNTCSGLRGILIKEEHAYGIEPLNSSKQFEHVLYTTAQQARASCSVTSKGSRAASTSRQQGSRKPHNLQAPSYLWSHTKYVEMFVVVNNQRFQMWGSSVNETVQGVVDIVALANSFTRAINTQVVLAGVEIWTEGDLIEVPEDLHATLRNFNSWRQEQLSQRVKHDVAHMIVGHHPGETMGQAFLNGACSSGFAAAVEAFHHEDVLLSAALLVHELGHNLGIPHDQSACICDDKHFCLMHESIAKESGFSNCSSDYFYQFLREHRGACLFNKPWHKGRKRRDSNCGNGIVELPEQCDCGNNCDQNPCCDSSCHFIGKAQCSDGLCCFQCEFSRKGSMCRDVATPCDLPEFCDGESSACPADSYKQDDTVCHNNHYCAKGFCLDPSSQCSHLFGAGAVSAPQECYTSFNKKGNRFGNCGQNADKSQYVPCSDDDILCGKLICTSLKHVPTVKKTYSAIQVPHGGDWCWSMDAYDNTDISDEGDVLSGTYCGPDKVCVNSTCTIKTKDALPCNSETLCNGNGFCNNLGHCHCNPGFAPPDCIKPGNGGSVDSGPPGKQHDPAKPQEEGSDTSENKNEELAINLVLLILLILLILIIIGIICGLLTFFKHAGEEAPPSTAEEAPPEGPPEGSPEGTPEEASEEASEESPSEEEESES